MKIKAPKNHLRIVKLTGGTHSPRCKAGRAKTVGHNKTVTEDYGLVNLVALKEAGYNIDGLNDAEKARIIYLTHHLGLRNAKRFINNEITEATARELLTAQIGRKAVMTRGKALGYVQAHRVWLMDYIDTNIKTDTYFCPELIKGKKIEVMALEFIIRKI